MKKYQIKALVKDEVIVKDVEETNISLAIQKFGVENVIHWCDIFSAVEIDNDFKNVNP